MIRRALLAAVAAVLLTPTGAHAAPATYEFEMSHAALPVLDQGTAGVCTFAVFANELNAARRADGRATSYGIDVAETAVNHGDAFDFTTPDGPMTLTLAPEVTVGADRDGIRRALEADGVVGLFVPSTAPGFAAAYHPYVRASKVPVIRWTHDTATVDHEVLAVGYTARGVMILNSWGPAFGLDGHAVLSWGVPAALRRRVRPGDRVVTVPRGGIPAAEPCGEQYRWEVDRFGVMVLCELPPGHEQGLHAGRVAAYSPGYTIDPSGLVVRWPVA